MSPTALERALLVYLEPSLTDAFHIRAINNPKLVMVAPLGIMYIAAVLKGEGIAPEIYDQRIIGGGYREFARRVKEGDFSLIGFSSGCALNEGVADYIRRLRDEGCTLPIVVGGPGHHFAELFLDAGADFVCVGEGEVTIKEIILHLQKQMPLSRLKGVIYKKKGKVVHAPLQEPIADLDTVPFPYRTQGLVDAYFDHAILAFRNPNISMMASRGCPFRCTYCFSSKQHGREPRTRSVANVIAEVKECRDRFGIKFVAFHDDNFGLKAGWLDEFLERYPRELDIGFRVAMHPVQIMGDYRSLAKRLKKAGCRTVVIGVQSINREILRAAGREPLDLGFLPDAINELKRAGLVVSLQFLFGLPGTTLDTMKADVDFVLKARPHYTDFYPLYPLVGTDLYDECRRIGKDAPTSFSAREIEMYCRKANAAFYGHPLILSQIVGTAAVTNPGWLAYAFKNFKHYYSRVEDSKN